MKGVQCYELFGGIALKIHTLSYHTLSLFRHLILYILVCLRVQFLTLCFSPCILSLSLPLFIRTLSRSIHLLMSCNYRCLPLTNYQIYFTLSSNVYVISKLGQLQTCLNLTTTRQNSCLPPPKELCISIIYVLQSLLVMFSYLQSICEEYWPYIRLSSYYE